MESRFNSSDGRMAMRITTFWISLAIIGLGFNAMSRFEGQSYDLRTRYAIKFREAPRSVKIITIDQQSLTYLSEKGISWPWFRSIYGTALSVLTRAGAEGVAIDMLFTEGSADRPDDDEEFVRIVGQSLPTVIATKLKRTRDKNHRIPGHVDRKLFVKLEDIAASDLKEMHGLLLPIDSLVGASSALGNVTSNRDSDGVFRRYNPYYVLDGQIVPGLSIALWHEVHPEQEPSKVISEHLKDGALAVKFYGPEHTIETIPFAAVFDAFVSIEQGAKPKLDINIFKNAYVFLGVTAPGLFDNIAVPVSDVYPGVEVNATVFANLLESSFVKQLGLLENGALALFWIALVSSVAFRTVSLTRLTGLLFATLVTFIALNTALVVIGFWSAMVVPLICMAGSTLSILAYLYSTEGRRRRFVRAAFAHYLNPNVIDSLLDNPDSLKLGGERRELTIFFSDIQGFTSLSEQVGPTVLVALLNEYLTRVTDVILTTDGTLDKYVGDAVMCFWNAPLPVPNHADKAVGAALDIKRILAKANNDFEAQYGIRLVTRIGIHTGEVTVGNFGSEKRFEYTIIGDAANLASRLEGLNKVFGTNLLVSESTRALCSTDVQFRSVGKVQVVGKTEAIEVFEPLLGGKELAAYRDAYDSFIEGEIREAYEAFKNLTEDSVASAYVRRIEREGLLGISEEEFDPVWILSTK